MTLKRAFRRVIWRAFCDKKYVDVLKIKKRESCNAFMFRLNKLTAFSLFFIVEIIMPFMSAFPAATVCSVILFAHILIIASSFLKKMD